VLYQVFGCPIKIHGNPGSRFENMSFSNLVLQEVTGPIHISIGPSAPQKSGATPDAALPPPDAHTPPAVVRNLAFSNIHGTVTTNPPELPESRVGGQANIAEKHSCIGLNCVGDSVMENISFSDIHLRFGGGGTAEEGARRDLPNFSGEYFLLGAMPAYGFYARNSRGITLDNVRFQQETPDLRPAVILDRVQDAAISGMSVEADQGAESAVRLINSKDVLLTGPRLLTSTATFLQVEGAENERIRMDGGDVTRAHTAVRLARGAKEGSTIVRS